VWAFVTLIAVGGAAPPPPAPGAGRLPPIVFVARAPLAGEPGAIPGLGPHHRAVVTGGRLMLREPDGRIRELLPPGALFDVSDPSVSPSAGRIAFAAVPAPGGPWRIWVVDVAGGEPRPLTADPAASGHDDLDPCWISDTSLVFASTRYGQRAQYADLPVTNLFLMTVAADGASPPRRITAERNGAEEPAMDWRTGRILFARWWYNRHRAADTPSGISDDPGAALARDTVNLWQVLALSPADPRPQLAAGDPARRRGTMGYQPAPLDDGSIAAVYAANLGLSPRPGATGIHRLSRRFGREARLVGALIEARAGDAYGGTAGLAPPAACSPAPLPDGRVLFAYDPGARGDFGLYATDGDRLERVADLPGTLELDPAPVVARPSAPRLPPPADDEREDPAAFARAAAAGAAAGDGAARAGSPPTEAASLAAGRGTFRYHNLDVFAGAGAASRREGACIRFFATIARPGHEGGDSAILVREAPVAAGGEVNERGLPADVPMFEQLVGRDGRVLMTAHGPAHVAGSNAGVAGTASRCVGCHLGHSVLPLGAAPPADGGR
jgi:hypothetical protein